MNNKANIALFIPHAGCPQQCSFCNQGCISGQQQPPTPAQVSQILEKAVAQLSPHRPTEIAFFGGSFTALERDYMLALLQAAQPFVGQKTVTGIRVSTRPDAITPEVVKLLQAHGVQAVELGAQSTNDRVLALNRRGHTAQDIGMAARVIQSQGMELGLQMMTGLYGSSSQIDRQTAKDLLALSPATMRIYPTVVFPGTQLYQWYEQGEYTPPSLEETVALCSDLLVACAAKGVRVIRLGLHGDGSLAGGGGPCHPALGEMCRARVYFKTVASLLPPGQGKATLFVHPTCRSQLVGQKRENIQKLAAMGWQCQVVEDPTLPPHTLGITRKENSHVPEILRSTGL